MNNKDKLKDYFIEVADKASAKAFEVIKTELNKMPYELWDEFNKTSWFDKTGNRDKTGEYTVFDMMQNYDAFEENQENELDEPTE